MHLFGFIIKELTEGVPVLFILFKTGCNEELLLTF